ncbi:hypothetical protein NKG05_09925 [Oerskovia sp. M15]
MVGTIAPVRRSTRSRPAVSFPRVLAAEWTKFSGLRSSLWIALGTVLAAATLAYALGMFVRPGTRARGVARRVRLRARPARVPGPGAAGRDQRVHHRHVPATFAAVPRRLPVLAAQVLITAAAALVTAVAALLASYLVTISSRAANGLVVDVTDGETARVLAGFVLYQTGVALLGLGIGALLRRPTAALLTGVMLLLVVDQVLAMNPGRIADTARALLPGWGSPPARRRPARRAGRDEPRPAPRPMGRGTRPRTVGGRPARPRGIPAASP